jgi:hypothetical protein
MNRRRSKPLNHSHSRPPTPKSLFRRVERTLDAIQQGEDILGTIRNVAEHMTTNFREDLGILGGRIYGLFGDNYELLQGFGSASDAPVGTKVPRAYRAIEAALDSGLVVMDRNAPDLDPELEAQLGTHEHFAAVAVADGDFLISFDLTSAHGVHEDLRASLNIVRLAINQKLHQGDVLVVYTDGITECHHHRSGEEFGLRRLEDLVRKHADEPAADIVQVIFRAAARFAGTSTPEDDQTVVVVRRPPAGDSAV